MSSDFDTDPPATAPAPSDPVAASRSDGDIWLELLAVLSIGVFPHLFSAIFAHFRPMPTPPSWLDSVQLTFYSLCIICPVLVLIHRSGESFTAHGVPRPEWADLGLAFAPFLAALALLWLVSPLLPRGRDDFFRPEPHRALDYVLLIIADAANGFAEELVVRAYLITRLERLLESSAVAVLLSTLLFASYHLHYGLWDTVRIGMFGLVFGVMFAVVPRVWPFALAHMAYNVFLVFEASMRQ